MQDADLFLELAGIAGVFVGFGALIAVRGGGASGSIEVSGMRGVVSYGLLAIVAALFPVTIGRFPFTEHEVWALSSALALVGVIAVTAVNALTPEYRESWTEWGPPRIPRWLIVAGVASVGLFFLATVLCPTVVLLGVAPDLEVALYFAFVVLALLWPAWFLLQMVFTGRPAASA